MGSPHLLLSLECTAPSLGAISRTQPWEQCCKDPLAAGIHVNFENYGGRVQRSLHWVATKTSLLCKFSCLWKTPPTNLEWLPLALVSSGPPCAGPIPNIHPGSPKAWSLDIRSLFSRLYCPNPPLSRLHLPSTAEAEAPPLPISKARPTNPPILSKGKLSALRSLEEHIWLSDPVPSKWSSWFQDQFLKDSTNFWRIISSLKSQCFSLQVKEA